MATIFYILLGGHHATLFESFRTVFGSLGAIGGAQLQLQLKVCDGARLLELCRFYHHACLQ
jgi:hypothetical protein